MTIPETPRKRTGFIDSTEAMTILGVTRQTLCRWVNEGRITSTRIGPSNKFDPSHLAEWLEQRQTRPSA